MNKVYSSGTSMRMRNPFTGDLMKGSKKHSMMDKGTPKGGKNSSGPLKSTKGYGAAKVGKK